MPRTTKRERESEVERERESTTTTSPEGRTAAFQRGQNSLKEATLAGCVAFKRI